jgi:LuxR family maltose regulon positive regulatory protein
MTDNLTGSLLSTKIQRPHVGRRLVSRPRLVEQLNPPNSLTFILAPAGYGKTTLLSTWLDTCQMPYAWLSLDEHDNDLAVFVNDLAVALHGILPAMIDNTLTMLNGITLPPADVITRTVLNDLARIEQDYILVLDDYHVILDRAIHDLMQELVSHPPQALHLVIASRYDPPFPLSSLRARGHVTELRGGDLRFTPEEAAQFLAETMTLTLDEETASVLVAKAEGWPAGLRLAALSLRQQQPLSLLAPDVLTDNLFIMDYLVAEVLSQLPISAQEFLIKSSILDQLCRPLCEAVTGMVDLTFNGLPILEWLERSDFFLTAAAGPQRWYRCHQLFRQLLRDRLEQQYGLTEIAALQLRASTWFASNGYLDEALHQALAAHDQPMAVQIIAQHRYELMNQAQWQRLERWLHLFPREVIDEQPHLLLVEVWLKFIHQQLREVSPLLDRVESQLPDLPPEIAEELLGEIASRRSALLYWNGDLAHSLALAQQALEQIPVQWWYIRGFTRVFMSSACLAAGDLTHAYATLYATGEPDQGQGYQNLLLGAACFIHWMAADLTGLAQAARQVVNNSTLTDVAEMVTFSRYHLGLYHYQRNDLAAAEKYLLPLVEQPYALHAACFLNSAVLLARLRQIRGRPEEAQKIVERLIAFALETRSEVVLFGGQAFQAELALRQGRLAESVQWAEQYGPFRQVPWPFAFLPPVTLASVLLAQDTPASRQQARELLAQMDEYFNSIHFTTGRISVLALQALLYNAEGDEQQALAALSSSIVLAAPGGFLRLFVDLGQALKPLVQKLASRDAQRDVSSAYLAEILAALEAEGTRPDAGQSLRREAVPTSSGSALLTNREQEVLELLAKRYTDKEIADTLVISPSTVSSHIDHLSNKLGARGRHAIVQAAKVQGLLA